MKASLFLQGINLTIILSSVWAQNLKQQIESLLDDASSVPCNHRINDLLPPQKPLTKSAMKAKHIIQRKKKNKKKNKKIKRKYKGSKVNCENGMADGYPCQNVNLLSLVDTSALNVAIGSLGNFLDSVNDLWGWTDESTGREFAIVGLVRGTAFVEITDTINPVYLGVLPTHLRRSSVWRDIKTYKHYAYIVSEAFNHGMQIFDLNVLLNVTSYQVFDEEYHFDEFGSAHNIFINEDTGIAYVVGTPRRDGCNAGLFMINIGINPTEPIFESCYAEDGYTHDVQCVIYKGSDDRYKGQEICFASNEDTLTIIDVTDKTAPVLLSKQGYPGFGYTHQGWLTDDHNHFIFDDELDEVQGRLNTQTRVFNVVDLKNPIFLGVHFGTTRAIDHNLYLRGDYIYQANYRAGLQVLKINNISTVDFEQVAMFDVFPNNDNARFNGAWSVYPFFPSKTIIVSGIEQGLFLFEADFEADT